MSASRFTRLAGTLLLVVASGCGESTEKKTLPPTIELPPPLPTIVAFEAAPEAVVAGEPTTLHWRTRDVTTIALADGAGNPVALADADAARGSVEVQPEETTSYTLTATGPDAAAGETWRTVTVFVTPGEMVPPVIEAFTASASVVQAGETVDLSWRTSHAVGLALKHEEGEIELGDAAIEAGTVTVSPTRSPTTYTLIATGPGGGRVHADVTVEVAGLPRVARFFVDPLVPVHVGESVELHWDTSHVERVVIRRDGAIVVDTTDEPSGSRAFQLADSATFDLEATGPGGTATARTVARVGPRISTFSADPRIVRANDSIDLSWEIADADRAVIDGPADYHRAISGEELAAGAASVEVLAGGDFVLQAFRGDVPRTASLSIQLTLAPRVRALAVDRTEVTAAADHPETVTVSWTQDGGDSCTLYRNNVAVPGFQGFACGRIGSAELPVFETTSVRLVAANAAGSHAAAVEVVAYPPARIVAFAGTPARRLGPGDPVELSWTVTDAVSVSMTEGGLPFPIGATQFTGVAGDIAVEGETAYVLTALNRLGHVTEAEVRVRAGLPELLVAVAEPDFVALGESVALRWTADGGDRLAITDEAGALVFETTDPGVIDAGTTTLLAPIVADTYTYTVQATNSAGSVSIPIDLVVSDGPMIRSFVASPARLSLGESTTFTWSVSNDVAGVPPTLALADDLGHTFPEIGTRNPNAGTLTIAPGEEGRHVYTLTASTPGTTPHTVSFVVEVTVPPFLHSFTATPDRVTTQGGTVVPQVQLAWTSENAVQVSLWEAEADGTPRPPALHRLSLATGASQAELDAGTFTVDPTVSTWYLARATNRVGTVVTALVKVVVDPPEVVAFAATPPQVVEGGTAQLAWTTRYATSVAIVPRPVVRLGATYVDVATLPGATQATLPDGNEVVTIPFPAGFTFPFEGVTRSSIQVSTEGWAGFDTANTATNATPYSFPTSSSYTEVNFAPYWCSLDQTYNTSPAGELWSGRGTDAQGDFFAVGWKHWSWYTSTYRPSDLNFELVLRPNGDFEYRYGAMSASTPARAAGEGCGIGYQGTTASRPWGQLVPHQAAADGGLANTGFAVAVSLPVNGTQAVNPPSTTAYTLTATNPDADATAETTVTVWKHPSIDLVTVDPAGPEATVPFRIRWVTRDATEIRVLDGSGAVVCTETNPALAGAGSCTVVEPTGGPKTYTVEAYNGPLGSPLTSTTRIFNFTVFELLRIDSFTITPDDMFAPSGHQVTATWTARGGFDYQLLDCIPNTQNCTDISPPTGTPLAGTVTLTLTRSTDLRLRVYDSWYRDATASHVIWIDAPTATLTATKTQVAPGEAVDLSWTTTGADRIQYPVTALEVTATAPYVDLSTSGGTPVTMVGTADSGRYTVNFPAGFSFPWFGTARTGLVATTDGWITFDMAYASSDYSNSPLPDSTNPALQLAPFWEDGEAVSPAAFYWKLEQPATGPRYLVVQWRDLEMYSDASSSMNFEVVLFENGDFDFRYGAMTGTGSYVDEARGSGATIGYQSPDRSASYQFSYNAEVPGGLANRSWRYSMSPTPSGSITVRPTETTTYRICADNESLYTACAQVTVVVVRPGDLLFTEAMIAPASDDAEWFELRNVTRYPIDLAGMNVAAGLEMYAIPATPPVVVPPGGFAVFARSGDPTVNGGVSPAVTYGTALTLDNAGDELRLVLGSTAIDAVGWTGTGWSIQPGRSITFEPSLQAPNPASNDSPAAWCASTAAYGTGGLFGSPGALGEGCITTGAFAWYVFDPAGQVPFLDIAATGTDDSGMLASTYYTDPIPLGFTMPYFGDTVTTMQIGRHGYVAFTPQTTSYSSNSAIPNSATLPNGFVAAFWDYLYYTTGVGKLQHEWRTVGTQQVMIVQWTAFAPGSTSYGTLDFQVQLWESGDIALVYRNLQRLNSSYDYLFGSSATFGLESVDGTVAHQIFSGTSTTGGPIQEGRSYLFRRRPPAPPVP